MYARISSFQCDPSRLEELTAKLGEIKAQINDIAGVVEVYSAWRADGHGVTTAIYESEAAANGAMPQVQAIWGGMADLLTGPPQIEGYDSVERLTA